MDYVSKKKQQIFLCYFVRQHLTSFILSTGDLEN